MNAARRNAAHRGFPRGLYCRDGWYYFRTPAGKTYPIGRVSLAVAKMEAIAANQHLESLKPSLVARMSGAANTIGQLLETMPVSEVYNTAKTARSLDNRIRAELGSISCHELTVAQCARFLEGVKEEGKARLAAALRTRLVEVCRAGVELGWLDTNPAAVTRKTGRVVVKRGRLTLETFHAIYAVAPQVAPWLQRMMMLGLVLGADRLTLAGLQRSDVIGSTLTYTRQKTSARIAVPLALRMEAVGVSLADLVNERTGVLSPFLVHHTAQQGRAKVGDPVHPDSISQAFTDARMLAGIADEGAPTMHELRSLCRRTYAAQGGVDVKALLGHSGQRVSDLYQDARGSEPVRVKIA